MHSNTAKAKGESSLTDWIIIAESKTREPYIHGNLRVIYFF